MYELKEEKNIIMREIAMETKTERRKTKRGQRKNSFCARDGTFLLAAFTCLWLSAVKFIVALDDEKAIKIVSLKFIFRRIDFH